MRKRGPVRFGCRIFLGSQEPFHRLIDRAQFCEKLGFDSVIIDDHLLYGTDMATAQDPFTLLAAIGLNTHRIRAGVAVTDLVRRHPAILAQTMGTLSRMIPKRIFLGLGTGDPMNQTPFGLSSEKSFSRLREGLTVMKMLWASSIKKPANFTGKFFSLKKAYLQTGPVSIPRIYLAAFGNKMLRLAGEQADGWIPHCHIPETYHKDLQKIRESAEKSGHSVEAFSPSYYTLASTSTSRQEADSNVLGPARYFLALIPEGLKKVDPSANHPGRVWEKLPHPRMQREKIREIASSIPAQTALDISIHGSPSDCIEQIAEFQKAGCREFMLTFTPKGGLWDPAGLSPMLGFFSKKVIQYYSEL